MIDFDPQYDSRNLTDGSFINQPKFYDLNPYLVIPNLLRYVYKSNFSINGMIKVRGEIYGDALSYILSNENVLSLTVTIKGRKVFKLPAIITNASNGEFKLVFNEWVFPEKGKYDCYLEMDSFIFSEKLEIYIV